MVGPKLPFPESVTVRGTHVALFFAQTPLASSELSEAERVLAPPPGPAMRQWLTGRAALRTALGGCTGGVVMPHAGLSLSHSRTTAVAARASGLVGLGVDIEFRAGINPKAARFFLQSEEQARLGRHDPALLRAWCIKEAAYKADPGNAGRALVEYGLEDAAAFSGLVWTPEGGMIYYGIMQAGDATLAVACNAGDLRGQSQ